MRESDKETLENDLDNEIAKEQALIPILMEREAKLARLQQAIDDNNKRINNIESSRTWKIVSPFSRLVPKKKRQRDEQASYIKDLEADLAATKQELQSTKERLAIETRQQDNTRVFQMLNDAKANGEMLTFLDYMIDVKQQNETLFDNAFKYIASLYKNEKYDYQNMVYQKMLSAMRPEDIPEMIVRTGHQSEEVTLAKASSFQANLTLRARQQQLTGDLPEWLLDDKEASYQFVDSLGVKRPWTSKTTYTLDTLPDNMDDTVIKPSDGAGSRGVYLVNTFHDIMDVKRSKYLKNRQTLTQHMQDDLTSGWVTRDEWMLEELIQEDTENNLPARDIKFYCFYGKVGLILEIIRTPELKYCWWTADSRRIRTGKYDEDLFRGAGVSDRDMELAADISLSIPAPFIRIDFLKGSEGLVFGEFTPKPGNYDEFDVTTDQWLGDLYLDADSRLNKDLLNAKSFEHYQNWLRE